MRRLIIAIAVVLALVSVAAPALADQCASGTCPIATVIQIGR